MRQQHPKERERERDPDAAVYAVISVLHYQYYVFVGRRSSDRGSLYNRNLTGSF